MLLKLTTITAAFLIWAPVAGAWTWPVQGPVLQPFSYDPAHPYASGQHRGIDIGAAAAGDPVVAPDSGTVSFAGSVPTNGESLTIETADGYSVTLTHLGSIAVAKGASVGEGAVVGTVGPSGTAEQTSPYVHLGIRTTSDANGYLDPLGLLPALTSPAQGSAGSGVSSSAGAGEGSSSAPAPTSAPAPVPVAPSEAAAPVAAASGGAGLVVDARPTAPHASVPEVKTRGVQPRVATSRHRRHHARRPAVEPVSEPRALRRTLEEPTGVRPSARGDKTLVETPATPVLMPLAFGAGPGLVATVAALATALARLRRRARPAASVVRFPEQRRLRRAA